MEAFQHMCELQAECVAVWGLTGRAEGGFDEGFGSGGHRLHRPGLFGCQLLQADPPLVKHLLHGRLLLEDLLHLVLSHSRTVSVKLCIHV